MILGQWSFKLLEAGIGPSSNSSSAASFSLLIDANGFSSPNHGLHLSEILKLGHCSTIKKYVNVDDRQLLIIEVRVNREIN